MSDCSEAIVDAVSDARADGRSLYISAGDSKRELVGRACDAAVLDISGHSGIVDYQPAELVITARAATPLVEIQQVLASQGQYLSFEPPLFDGRATLGGTLACNLSGPARPWGGSVRDMVLGVQLINGRAELLNFGGRVMKNVAGYDVARLQAGALGTLGVISEISLKVLPHPEHSLGLVYEMDAQEAVATMNRRAGQPGSLSGAFWMDERLHLRLSGATAAVQHTARLWGGEMMADDDHSWRQLRDMSLPFFGGPAPLWRFSLNCATPVAPGLGATLIDWCGSQRWIRGEQDWQQLAEVATCGGGHVALFRGGDRCDEVRPVLNPLAQGLHRRLKQCFDPDGIFNPGRLYSWM
jgi:glycolate oxidase FAD binding subunit